MSMISEKYKRQVQSGKSHWLDRKSFSPEILEIIKGHFKKLDNLKLLDIGCAQGRNVFEFSRSGILAEGVDINKEFINHAKTRYPSLNFAVGDIENLYNEKRIFDVVVCMNTLFYTDIYKSLQETERLVKPGGLGIITLDEKIINLDSNKVIHNLNIEIALSLLKKSIILKKELKERVDKKPFRHVHKYYQIIFKKLNG